MKISDVNHHLELHLRDYKEVRDDVDGIQHWFTWVVKIVIGSIVVALLTLIGLSK